MEKVAPSNLWQIELHLEENSDKDIKPEDIFLLENIDQILLGTDDRFKKQGEVKQQRKTMEKITRESTSENKYTKFAKFTFKDSS